VILTMLLLAGSFVLLLAGAVVFTNAIEWAGQRLDLGSGAVGSILAAVATALPESIIPVVAIISGEETGQIAIGAIIGAPFLLGTLAMVLVGISALGFRARREQDTELRLDRETTRRDLIIFLVFFGIAVLLGLGAPPLVRYLAAAVFLISYGLYAWRSIARGGSADDAEDPGSLFFDPSKQNPPSNPQIVVQVLVGLGLIIGGAQLFVTEVEEIAHSYGVPALVLALILAPLATELPEKVNSVLWVRQGKDALALGNITGAMVFQSMIPVSVGLVFLDWKLSPPAMVAAVCALAGGALCLLLVQRGSRFRAPAVFGWAALYAGTVGYVLVAG
jgi:cation:H+ antiporter